MSVNHFELERSFMRTMLSKIRLKLHHMLAQQLSILLRRLASQRPMPSMFLRHIHKKQQMCSLPIIMQILFKRDLLFRLCPELLYVAKLLRQRMPIKQDP